MDWLSAAIGIYVIGSVILAVVMMGAVASETTAHGQEILIGMGCLLVLFWPIALIWASIVAIGSAVGTGWRVLLYALGKRG